MSDPNQKHPLAKTEAGTTTALKHQRSQKVDRIESYGDILADGTTIECIFDAANSPSCSFAVSKPDGIHTIEQSYDKNGVTIFPPQRQAKRFEKRFVILPSKLEDYNTPIQLLNNIENHLKKYVDLDPFDISMLSNYSMMTWAWDAWNAVPYLRFQGQPGTGKTRCLEVLKEICYKAVDLGVNPTPAGLFRSIDSVRGTFLIDEADYDGDFQTELIKLLNSGYRKDGVHTLCGKTDDEWEPRTLSVGGPKIIANRHSFKDEALESRCITINTVCKKLDPRIPTQFPKEYRDECLSLRNQLLKWRLDNLHSFTQCQTALQDLDGRPRELSLPIYNCSPDIQFKDEFVQFMKRRSRHLAEANPVRVIMEAMAAVPDLMTRKNVSLQKLSSDAMSIGREQDIPDYVFTPKKVAEIIRGLRLETGRRTHGRVVLINPVIMKEQFEHFHIGDAGGAGGDSI